MLVVKKKTIQYSNGTGLQCVKLKTIGKNRTKFMIIIFGKAFNSQFWNKMAFALSTNTLSKEVNKNIMKKLNDLEEITKFENFDKYDDFIHKLIHKSYTKKT